MNIDDLIAQYLELRDQMPDQNQHELSDALRDDETLQARFRDLLLMDDLLSRTILPERREFAARVKSCLQRAGSSEKFVVSVKRKVRMRQVHVRWYAAAAAVLVALSGWLVFGSYTGGNAAIATLSCYDAVVLHRQSENLTARSGFGLRIGDEIETASSAATVRYGDGSTLWLNPNSTMRLTDRDRAKVAEVRRGVVRADVAHQPLGKPFRFESTSASATVLGTILTFRVSSESTRLEVERGEVQFRVTSSGESVLVPAGFAADSADIPLAIKPISSGTLETLTSAPSGVLYPEIVLRPQQGKIVGGSHWYLVPDAHASTGVALESRDAIDSLFDGTVAPYVEYQFQADGGVPYNIWGRGCAIAPKDWEIADIMRSDSFGLVPTDASFNIPDRWFGLLHINAFMIDYFSARPGYWWVGGNFNMPENEELGGPVTITFKHSGMQVLKMYALESPMRVDTIWLSTSQKSRPDAKYMGK